MMIRWFLRAEARVQSVWNLWKQSPTPVDVSPRTFLLHIISPTIQTHI